MAIGGRPRVPQPKVDSNLAARIQLKVWTVHDEIQQPMTQYGGAHYQGALRSAAQNVVGPAEEDRPLGGHQQAVRDGIVGESQR